MIYSHSKLDKNYMYWILQGNPKYFDVDTYLSSYVTVYWTVNHSVEEIIPGHTIFFWRSGGNSGVIGKGIVQEVPRKIKDIPTQEITGTELWKNNREDGDVHKVKVQISDVRLSLEEGMIPRETVKNDPHFLDNTIITVNVGTVHKLSGSEFNFINSLWNNEISPKNSDDNVISVFEGKRKLRYHYTRERNSKIIKEKKTQFLEDKGRLFCEVCSFDFSENYPKDLGNNFIEVHHIVPISETDEPTKTTLDDLVLLCSNCHRMVHRTNEVEQNLESIKNYFSKS